MRAAESQSKTLTRDQTRIDFHLDSFLPRMEDGSEGANLAAGRPVRRLLQ